jgi:hypothetical protein
MSKRQLLVVGYALFGVICLRCWAAPPSVTAFGDLVSSIVVGVLWSRVSAGAGFMYDAVLTLAGAVALGAMPLGGDRL